MAKITNIQLVECFTQCLAERWGYVYGCRGVLYSEKEAVKRRDGNYSVPSGRSKSTYFTIDCAQWYGRMVADCSGGITYAVQQHDPTFKALTANGYRLSFTDDQGLIEAIPEIPGLAVWKEGHIGVYVGNGKVIEFRGTDYGCVETNLKDRKFTHWGRLHCVEYLNDVEAKPEQPAEPTESAPQLPFHAVVSGGSVYVRADRSAESTELLTAYKGTSIFALPAVNGWCEIIIGNKGGFLQGFMSAKYVQEVKGQ